MNLTDYISSDAKISQSKLDECQDRMRQVLINDFPDTGFSPNSVVGKFLIERFGKILAQIETALNCVLSDMDLINVINGSVCNCTFVTEFLRGLGVDNLVNANTTGTARINFIVNGMGGDGQTPFVMDKGELLQFNDTYIFNYATPKNAEIYIYPYNYSGEVDKTKNYFFLSVASVANSGESSTIYTPNLYFVDIPIVGSPNATVTEGDEAAINEHLPFFDVVESVVAAYDIAPFEVPTTLQELITLALKVQPSCNFATKGNIISYVEQKYPGIVGVSPTKMGDEEMVRTIENPTLTFQPAIDIWVKGSTTLKECTEFVKFSTITYHTEPDTIVTQIDSFTSPVRLNHYPIMHKSLALLDDSVSTLNQSVNSGSGPLTPSEFNLMAQGKTTCATDKATNEYTDKPTSGKYFFDFYSKDYQFQMAGLTGILMDNQLSNYTDSNNEIWIKYTYYYDPVVESLAAFVDSPACEPAISTQVKPCYYYIIDSFTVNYLKSTNKFFDRQNAIEKIYDLMNSLVYPLQYSDAYISDIMVAMGAAGVSGITISAHAFLSSAYNYRSKGGTELATVATVVQNNLTTISNSTLISYGAGPRSMSVILPKENIILRETLTA